MSDGADGIGSLARHVENWSPEPVERVDVVRRRDLVALARTLGLDEDHHAGTHAPILAHWTSFHDWLPTADLGEDGHPADGHFFPPIPHRRRMFAGSTVMAQAPLRVDVETVARTSVLSVTPKTGRSGEMLFVTMRTDYSQGGRLCRTEDQQIVYRSDDSARPRPPVVTPVEPEPTAGATSVRRSMSPVVLFRFSALTANAHRIHYDQDYATSVEGYPRLVVHGPLLATLMADQVTVRWGAAGVRRFAFTLRSPVFVGDPFLVEHTGSDESARVAVVTGDVVASADAERA